MAVMKSDSIPSLMEFPIHSTVFHNVRWFGWYRVHSLTNMELHIVFGGKMETTILEQFKNDKKIKINKMHWISKN